MHILLYVTCGLCANEHVGVNILLIVRSVSEELWVEPIWCYFSVMPLSCSVYCLVRTKTRFLSLEYHLCSSPPVVMALFLVNLFRRFLCHSFQKKNHFADKVNQSSFIIVLSAPFQMCLFPCSSSINFFNLYFTSGCTALCHFVPTLSGFERVGSELRISSKHFTSYN